MTIKPKHISSLMTTDSELSAEVTARQNLETSINNSITKLNTIHSDTTEPSGFVNRTDSTMSFNTSTRTFSIAPVSSSFSVYVGGVKVNILTTLSKQIPDVTGNYYFYINGSGVLDVMSTFDLSLISTYAYCAYVYWDSANAKLVSFGEERHGITMDGATHAYLHSTRGAQLASGASIGFTTTGDGTVNGDAQISISDCSVRDEDISIQITNNASPSQPFQQVLSPIASIPVYYKVGSTWTKDVATSYPLKQGTLRAQFNKNTGGTWSTQDATANNKFLVSYIFATTNITEPIIALLGQDEYTSIADANTRASWSNISFGDFPATEMKLLYIVVYETSSTFTNIPKAAIRDVSDLRFGTDREVSATSFNTDHSNLSGLGNDDHLQYLPLSGIRPMVGTLDLNNNNINNVKNLNIEETTAPTAPAAGLTAYGKNISGRQMFGQIDKNGWDYSFQSFLARNKVGVWMPPGNATTAPGVFGIAAFSATGTATARNVATTNMFTRTRRLGYVSTATAGALSGARIAAAQLTTGAGGNPSLGGFHFVCRFGCSDAATVSTARQFVGVSSSTAAPTNVEPSTLTNVIGVGHGAADANLKLFYGAGTAQTPIDLGVNFPKNTLSTDLYELSLYSPASVTNTVYYQVTRLNTNDVVSGVLTANVPASTTLLTFQAWRSNNATAAAVGLDIASLYIETDN